MWTFAIAVVLLAIVAGAISLPLLRHQLEPYDLPDLTDDSFSERDALLEALSDLEDSHLAGKVSKDDYVAQKQRLELRYIKVIEGGDSPA